MYWVVISLFHVVESYLAFVLAYVPFYAWLRLSAHLWLVLPGKQGATHIYTSYVDPWLSEHEQEIETFISEAHDRAKQAGMEYLKQAIAWAKVNILGQQPPPPSPPAPASMSYAQQLLARFNMPAAPGAPSATDVYSMLSSALAGVAGAAGASREQKAQDLSASGTLIPPELEGKSGEEKMRYVSATRESLRVLLQAYDKEAFTLASEGGSPAAAPMAAPMADLSKSRSETDFDKIDRDEVALGAVGAAAIEAGKVPQRTTSGGWMPWNWNAGQAPDVEGDKKTQ